MKGAGRTKRELLDEIAMLKERIDALEASEKRQAALERALEKSDAKFRTLTEKSVVGVYLIQDDLFRYVNPKLAEIFGYETDDIIDKMPVLDLVYDDDRPLLDRNLRSRLSGRVDSMNYQFRGLKKDRSIILIEAYGSRMDYEGAPAVIGSLIDISERAAMEASLREHEQMAYVGQLSASLSHEIRNPLSAIKMNLQILARKLNLDGNDSRRLEITVHEVSRLEGILRQLLDIARPLSVDLAPVDAIALVRGCVELLRGKAQERNIEIVEEYPEAFALVRLDAGKVEQALINLLLNALDATPEQGRITIWLKITGDRERHVEFGVRDTGPGIDPERLPQLFRPFSTTKRHGSGLGLSNVKRIVQAHSGTVEVATGKGSGATFLLRFPWLV